MPEQPKEKSLAGPLLLLFVLLFDVGLAVWGWHVYQMKQAQYSAVGLNVASAPKSPLPIRNFAPQAPPPMADPSRNIIKSPDIVFGGRPAAGQSAQAARSPATAGGTEAPARQARPETRLGVRRASAVYFALKRNPRFRNSPVIQAWKREFLSYPDLRAINAQYQKDQDPIAFLVHMARSPNFSTMLGKYLQTPDIQDFIRAMRANPMVLAAASNFLSDYNLKAAVKRLPGYSEGEAPNPSGLQQVQAQALRSSPAAAP